MNKNYTLIKEEYIDEIKSQVTYLKHNKSGARILLLKNNDPNKTFTISFRTTPINDTGVPHILEHSTLCGSKKFPVKDPFIELIKSSLNTFINAMTAPDKTMYPVASLNLKDFKNLMEVYMDAVFYPNVYIHEEIFKQEGWHYELNDIDGDIIYNGIVYNEMKGVFSDPEQVISRLVRHELFPDNTYGAESGGDPECIPDLSYEEFKMFHSKFYSPSNSYIVLYGDLDMDERLDWMDQEYLSKFDIVADFDTSIKEQKPFDKVVNKQYEYAIGKEEDKTNKTYYSYAVVTSKYDEPIINVALSLLIDALFNEPGAPVKQALLDKGLGESVEGDFQDDMLQECVEILSKSAPAGKEEEFYLTIEEELKKQIEKGIDKKVLESLINNEKFNVKEADFGRAPKGLFYTMGALSTWVYNDDAATDGLKMNYIYDELMEKLNTSFFEDLLRDKILNNNHKLILTLSPSNNLAEEKAKKVADKLAKFKATLTKEQLEELVKDTAHLKEYQSTPSTKEELAMMPKLTLDDIDKESQKNVNTIDECAGITVVRHELDTNDIEYVNLSFDITKIPEDLIPYVGLLNSMFALVSTKKHSYKDLNIAIKIETGGITQGYNSCQTENGLKYYLEVKGRALKEKLGSLFDLISEIIMESRFDDEGRMKDNILETISYIQNSMIARGNATASRRATSYFDELSLMNEKLMGIDFYNFIKDIGEKMDIKDINDKLCYVSKLIYRKENLIMSYTSLDKEYEKYLPKFVDNLYKDKIEISKSAFKPCIKNEAFKTSSQVNYVAVASKYGTYKDYHGSVLVLSVLLRYDYLWTQIRVLGGAYGQSINVTRSGMIVASTYRDSNISRSINVIKNIPQYIENLNLSKEDLVSNIISVIGVIDTPNNARTLGETSYANYLGGIDDSLIQRIRDEVLSTTLDDIKSYKPLFEKALADPALCVIGNEQKIDEDGKDFKEKKILL